MMKAQKDTETVKALQQVTMANKVIVDKLEGDSADYGGILSPIANTPVNKAVFKFLLGLRVN